MCSLNRCSCLKLPILSNLFGPIWKCYFCLVPYQSTQALCWGTASYLCRAKVMDPGAQNALDFHYEPSSVAHVEGALCVHPIHSEWRDGGCSSMTPYLMVCLRHWSHQSEGIKPGFHRYGLNNYSSHTDTHTHTHTHTHMHAHPDSHSDTHTHPHTPLFFCHSSPSLCFSFFLSVTEGDLRSKCSSRKMCQLSR